MPSQVIYGSIIDTACSLWSKSDKAQSSYCQIYDNTDFRVRYHLITAMFQFLSMIFVAMGCYFAKNFPFHRDTEDVEEEQQQKHRTN